MDMNLTEHHPSLHPPTVAATRRGAVVLLGRGERHRNGRTIVVVHIVVVAKMSVVEIVVRRETDIVAAVGIVFVVVLVVVAAARQPKDARIRLLQARQDLCKSLGNSIFPHLKATKGQVSRRRHERIVKHQAAAAVRMRKEGRGVKKVDPIVLVSKLSESAVDGLDGCP